MTNEELILERLDRIERQIAPMARASNTITGLKDDLTPLMNQAFRLLIKELSDVEASVQLEDILELIKRSLRSVRDILFSLEQLQGIVDLIKTVEPLMRSSVPKIISYLDEMEQKGVFRMMTATLEVRAKAAAAYDVEDIDQIGDGLIAMLGLLQKVSDPKTLALLEKLAEIPANLDLTNAKKVGPFGLVSAASSKEVKEGVGVLMELTKAMGQLKEIEDTAS